MSGLFVCFLLTAAGQDLKRKSVELWIYLVFGGLALAYLIYGSAVCGKQIEWGSLASGVCVGLGLLGCGMVCQGAIGMGDGCFFLVSGLMLGFWNNLALLLYGLLCCSVYCLGFLTWNRIRYQRNVRKETVPFLPFLVPAGIWLVLK